MRNLSADERAQGIECPFKPSSFELEALSREIKDIAANLPAEWDLAPHRSPRAKLRHARQSLVFVKPGNILAYEGGDRNGSNIALR